MYYRMIRNDLSRSKLITMTTLIFVAAAAMLVSLAAILTVNLSGAIDTLMVKAKTPHFMQMHTGELDMKRLSAFAEQNGEVDDYQVLEFLNMDSAKVTLGGQSLADQVQDIGFSVQSEAFDYLLDLKGHAIRAEEGELYVPLTYMKDGTTRIGDTAVIGEKTLTVAGFLRDSQMNSTLASSKRFLVSAKDYAELQSQGSVEYLIEFRLKNLSALGAFEAAYAAAGLEANGPTITYPLFRMINAISDGMMIGVILLVSLLVVAIALMCIRFTLLAKIEDDYREIGVMKAIGLRIADIKRIYLAKYAAVAAAGSLLGFVLSLGFQGLLLENIRLYMGESDQASLGAILGIIGILLVFLAIIAYVNGVLRRFRHISPAEAIRFGTARQKVSGTGSLRLSRSGWLNTNVFLGIKDVLSRKRLYATMLAVLVISAFIMIVPQNLHATISSKDFTQYMGIGDADLRMDLRQTGHLSEQAAEITDALEGDSAILSYVMLTTKSFSVKLENGSEERLKIELGDHSRFPIKYAEGGAPGADHEIALSAINAQELDVQVGDFLNVELQGKPVRLTVSGIYSDITNGGKTAKAVFTDPSAEQMWCIFYAELADPAQTISKAGEYADRFPETKVSDMDEYIAQTFGSTRSSIEMASYAAMAVALIITVLVTLLFMHMLVFKDRYAISVMKAFGFTNGDIQLQFLSRSAFILVAGVVLGTLLANTAGEKLAGAVISSFGASAFQFTSDPVSSYVLIPLLMAGLVLIATIIGTSGAGAIKISEHIKE
ncbi:ABC transporter permease [Paenibacillus apis]|uniref:ABC transporter permease n=1 Tax=Paenibacillus apis TaxID=1792174 RepID=A0A920CJ86_9BACL|nr:ABC transporter permease [Paenibacillus apis]GIO41335.1 ABC transporter permease [Paenibacillus apis]